MRRLPNAHCGGSHYTKLLSAGGFQFKGSGWYATDFKHSQKTRAAAVCGQRLRRRLRGMTQGNFTLKACLLTGVLIWLPFAVTLWVLDMVISTMDSMINWLPMALQPTHWFGMHIPGSGLALALLIVLMTGFLAANMLGQKVVACGKACWAASRW